MRARTKKDAFCYDWLLLLVYYIGSVQCDLLKLSNTLGTSALSGPMTSNDEHVVLLRVIRVLLARSEYFYGVLSGEYLIS
jgi:hypothetical protein